MEVTLVKEWCDKEGKQQPQYTFTGFGTNWLCQISVDWLQKNIYSDNCTSKKLAKQDAARLLWLKIADIKKQHYKMKERTLMLIDGDQRMDCWSYLADKDISWENMDILAFVGLTSNSINCSDISIFRAKTTAKDSADALILITLGRELEKGNYDKIIIVSEDHILVQAAADTEGVEWRDGVEDMKRYLVENSF